MVETLIVSCREVFTIGQVAEQLGVSTSTLKNWEQHGYISKPRRVNLNKIRVYTREQIGEIAQFMRNRR